MPIFRTHPPLIEIALEFVNPHDREAAAAALEQVKSDLDFEYRVLPEYGLDD
ncbi:hypothetical protein [Meiothermus sp. Pnk-1]|uniref:hypothetical protein n=1 Tax=Meiothermus sp. Pnk-1 TaxID=873128 RepID=UPI001313F9FD|nr:hypothetical protein [Meiothermus sp. Pnk-1]